MTTESWQIWIDTGGTFTDCIGVDPGGSMHKVKVLSSSSLRGSITESLKANRFTIEHDWYAPSGFIEGFHFNLLGVTHPECKVTYFDAEKGELEIDTYLKELENAGHASFEVISPYEAPILACRLITGTLPDDSLPPVSIRLATTKGTNALLENKTAPTMLLINKGFGDLLRIGDQKRPDLFAKEIIKPDPMYSEVCEIPGRIDADGEILQELNPEETNDAISKFLKEPDAAFAVCLMNSYKNSEHEQTLKDHLNKKGAEYVSVSSELNPFIKILPRAQTTVVNAALSPVLKKYLENVKSGIEGSTLHVMTSAGGLINAKDFQPKDSLLSGPAGGVVGASSIGRANGYSKVISFDMGGTSTDVARYDHDFDYVFEHQVGHAKLNAPALSIETVAAGGGSICSFDGNKLTVGPDSSGAFPGPACYGAGGPLSLTDINLLMGRLEKENFGIPIDPKQSEKAFIELLESIKETGTEQPDRKQILQGFLQIANERMANAIRKISMRKGYDPSEYALVGFGGAGAQHVCAIAEELEINDILIPAHAGLLSAYGLGAAVIERFAEKQVLDSLEKVEPRLETTLEKLRREAKRELREKENVRDEQIRIRKELVFMRIKGQDSTLKVDYRKQGNLGSAFKEAYKQRYGHWIEGSNIEIESIRAVASTHPSGHEFQVSGLEKKGRDPVRTKPIQFEGKQVETPVFNRKNLPPGEKVNGPALILD
ncbi:MAG: hydantoinase/oxoprolinase family protein, partial [Balneolaceae bacterium]|nr:hydantoinase/oxoprolinase family protein [Balneolaceae bacterium]